MAKKKADKKGERFNARLHADDMKFVEGIDANKSEALRKLIAHARACEGFGLTVSEAMWLLSQYFPRKITWPERSGVARVMPAAPVPKAAAGPPLVAETWKAIAVGVPIT